MLIVNDSCVEKSISALQHDIAIIKNEFYKYKETTENESI